MPAHDSFLILAFVDDLYFVSRIESVAKQLGFEAQIVENPAPEDACDGFVDLLAQTSPALVIIDLNTRTLRWVDCVPAAKASTQVSQIPMLAFGSHKDVETMTQAREAGIDVVLAKSRFTGAMGELIQKYAQKGA